MSKTIVKPTLSLGNHIYLYRLLRDAIGCGKQTFMTQVEEALAAGDMAAYDLGFESTRELLEELDDCIKLTVFKGGRLYATVIANEAWDAALAKGEDKPKATKGAKQSYKKKKRGEKDLKAVRPKHVKRPESESAVEVEAAPEPEVEVEAVVETMTEAEVMTVTAVSPEVTPEQEAATEQGAESAEESNETPAPAAEKPADQPAAPAFQNSDVFGDGPEDDQADEPAEQDAAEAKPEPEVPQPAISLTVVYDPENANAGITTMASTPVEAKPNAEGENAPQAEAKPVTADAPVITEPADVTAVPETTTKPAPAAKPVVEPVRTPEPAPAPTSVPAPAAPTIPEDFPVDFATEVFCPGPLLHQLSTYLPYGADTLGIVGEYYWIARERGIIDAARNRASFPLRYTQAGERHEVTVRIRRNTTGGLGAAWTIDKVEEPEQ